MEAKYFIGTGPEDFMLKPMCRIDNKLELFELISENSPIEAMKRLLASGTVKSIPFTWRSWVDPPEYDRPYDWSLTRGC